MNNDERFAANLRTQAARVAPKIDVDLTRVVPAARRRRAARVGGVTLAMGLVLAGGAWAATSATSPSALPGGSTTVEVEPSPKPSGPPETTFEGDDLPTEPSHPVESPIVPPEGWRGASYLHVVTRAEGSKEGETSEDDGPWGSERWYGDGVSFERTSTGPVLFDASTSVNLGHTAETNVSLTWSELAQLPTEPGALYDALLSMYEPAGQGEEGVLAATAGLLLEAPAPTELRAAAWELLLTLPEVETELGVQDSQGRLGTAASFVEFDRSRTIIYDEERNVLLEDEEAIGKLHFVSTTLESTFGPLPKEVADSAIEVPDFTAMTLEDAGTACQQAHLTCTFEDTPSDTVPEGTIISSDPQSGALVSWGALVTLQLSTAS